MLGSEMPFDLRKLRVERVHVALTYHAAFQYWNAKALLAERWAHGPYFGGWAEGVGGEQLLLTPAGPASDLTADRRQAVAGMRSSGLTAETVTSYEETHKLAVEWLGDCVTALKPKRTISTVSQIFGLYPITNEMRTTEKLRDRFFAPGELDKAVPARYRDDYLCSLNLAHFGKNGTFACIVGVVGPPHMGQFFQVPDPTRDERWWLGFKLDAMLERADGFEDPVKTAAEQADQLWSDLQAAVATVAPSAIA